ncbi:BnaA03g58440D [Brassica napus]|uniref:BnaA03g58440D protein n=1 Tax=Brassica napus TaxID=3708 RepID=A0A078J7C8_BRANA|nr:BnaA03g58440D [Brassica napus]
MSGNDDAETAKIEVWWDMKNCPIPEGYDARRVRPSIERAFNKRGYSTCPVSITAYGDQNQTPCHVLRGLSSTGVAVAHTKSESTRSVMYRDMVEWRELSCVTETWAKNYPAMPEHATAKILVLWNMNDCPIPEGYDACRVRPSIERALKEVGYTGPVSITAYADQKQTPDHHLLALSSTGVDYAHTLPSVEYSRMITDFEEWAEDNPAPASIMIISNELALRKSHSSRVCRKLQESNYKCFLAYSVRPFKMPVLLTSAEWLWESLLSGGCFLSTGLAHVPIITSTEDLLAVSETKRHILQTCSGSEMVVASTGMFYCDLCDYDYNSLDDFKKHLSRKEHTYEVGYPPKTKRIRKAPRKCFLLRPLRFTRR